MFFCRGGGIVDLGFKIPDFLIMGFKSSPVPLKYFYETKDFDFDLPKKLIANELVSRTDSRLMLLNPKFHTKVQRPCWSFAE